MDEFDLYQLLQGMTPDEQLASMRQGTLPQRSKLVSEQLALADALRQGVGKQQHSTPGGAMLGGMADILNTFTSKNMRDNAMQQQKGMLDESDLVARLYAQKIAEQRRRAMQGMQPQQPQAAPAQQPQSQPAYGPDIYDFGFGG